MWQLKFRVYEEENKIRKIIEKTRVKVYYYPVNHYIKNNRYFFIATGIAKGGEKQISSFFRNLEKLKKAPQGRRLETLEKEKGFFIIISSHPVSEEMKKYVHVFYNPKVMHLKPVVFRGDGEEWEIASIEKKELNRIMEIGKKVYDLKLLQFRQKKANNFGFLTLLPELTEKQQSALMLALDAGYYNYPRKISLDRLSKLAKLSFSTFQAHVRKAENKIMSFVMDLKK